MTNLVRDAIDRNARRKQRVTKIDTSRYGSAAPVGRRIRDEDLIEKRERHFDPEAARQRRLGAASALGAAGGGALMFRGGRSAVRATRGLHAVTNRVGMNREAAAALDAAQRSRGVFIPGHAGAQLAGGAAAVGGAAGANRYARSRRNRRWE